MLAVAAGVYATFGVGMLGLLAGASWAVSLSAATVTAALYLLGALIVRRVGWGRRAWEGLTHPPLPGLPNGGTDGASARWHHVEPVPARPGDGESAR